MNDKELQSILDDLLRSNPNSVPRVIYTGEPDNEATFLAGVRKVLEKTKEKQRKDAIWNAAMKSALKSKTRFTPKKRP